MAFIFSISKRILTVFIGLTLFCSSPGFADGDRATEAAIERGLGWIAAHPATDDDGGFLDLVDEGLFYMTIERLSTDTQDQIRYKRAFEACVSGIAASAGFQSRLQKPRKPLIDHYHLLLASLLMETLHLPIPGRGQIIVKARDALEQSAYEHPSFRVTVGLLLNHLGTPPRVGLDELLDISLINHLRQGKTGPPAFIPLHTQYLFYYAVVHEVAALTNFGRLCPPSWLRDRREQVGEIFRDGSRLAVAAGNIDLLAEMILGNHMLGLPVTDEIRQGTKYLVENQHADGSWGEQQTLRANRVRHAVQTATAALLAYLPTSATHQ